MALKHLARRARKALEIDGRTQMQMAVELGIGLSTFRGVLEGQQIKNLEKRRAVEQWIINSEKED